MSSPPSDALAVTMYVSPALPPLPPSTPLHSQPPSTNLTPFPPPSPLHPRNSNASARVVVPLPELGNTAFTVVPGLTVEQFLGDLKREDKALADARLFTDEGTNLAGTTFLRQVRALRRPAAPSRAPAVLLQR